MMTVVVLDTNVVVSFLIAARGPIGRIFREIERGAVVLLISHEILGEYDHALKYDRVRNLHKLSDSEVTIRIMDLVRVGVFVPAFESLGPIASDPNDDMFLECAVAGEADFIITGDRHLLEIGEYQGVRIVTASAFMAYWDMIAEDE
jgi:putative PIN family toxin of toxin-antitoxin system